MINSIMWIITYFLTFKLLSLIICSMIHYSKKYKKTNYKPMVSILIPCYNESLTLLNCVNSIIKQNYKNFEILIIDDGSTDNTLDVAKNINNKKVKVFTKKNGGKASALNYGIKNAKGELIISLDADSIFIKNTLQEITKPFVNKNTVACCGNIKISNPNNILTNLQSLEYISGLNIQRRTFAYLNCMQVISGAIGCFRKDKLLEINGYSTDTIVEDMDITIAISKLGNVDYIGDAIAYTEAPENIKDFCKQRYRWVYGSFEVLFKYKDMLFNTKNITRMGSIGLPYIIVSMIIDVLITILGMYIIIYNIFIIYDTTILILLTLVISLQFIIFLYCNILDSVSIKSSIIFTPLYTLIYSPIINLIMIYSFIHFCIGTKPTWNKVKRLGKNVI